jgi:hypothetical protein
MLTRLFLITCLGLPSVALAQAEPIYNFYDCKGKEAICRAVFGPVVAPRANPETYIVGGRTVVSGVDLGPSNPAVDVPSFRVLYDRLPWVVVWRACCDDDFDGHAVIVRIAGGVATMFEFPELSGPSPTALGRFGDINASGQLIGEQTNDDGPYILTPRLTPTGPSVDLLIGFDVSHLANASLWAPIIGDWFGGQHTRLLQINDAGQIIGTTRFHVGEDVESRFFLLSPIGTPAPKGLAAIPEPGTRASFLFGLGAVVLVALRRRRT